MSVIESIIKDLVPLHPGLRDFLITFAKISAKTTGEKLRIM